MMFNKIVAVVTAVVGASSLLAGVAALPTNITESAVGARSINPAGNHVGQLTYFDIGLGACGWRNTNTEWVAAISHELYDNWPGYTGGNPNNNPVCTTPHTADITYGGKTIRVGIVDRCEGCALWDVDLSPSAFHSLLRWLPVVSMVLRGTSTKDSHAIASHRCKIGLAVEFYI
ncbi:Lytic transglycosylase [Rhizoctonia solani]|uniref:Lytic transglycosylase n=1 Tax=Rhizoctonia solani TaxID=456999 RepID=A0A8H7IKT4_9AGAM|nr:Lytic transglycosylase [Rhizoctonia solani]